MEAITKDFKAIPDQDGKEIIILPKEVVGSQDRPVDVGYISIDGASFGRTSVSFGVKVVDKAGFPAVNQHEVSYDDFVNSPERAQLMGQVIAILDELLMDVPYLKEKIEEKV